MRDLVGTIAVSCRHGPEQQRRACEPGPTSGSDHSAQPSSVCSSHNARPYSQIFLLSGSPPDDKVFAWPSTLARSSPSQAGTSPRPCARRPSSPPSARSRPPPAAALQPSPTWQVSHGAPTRRQPAVRHLEAPPFLDIAHQQPSRPHPSSPEPSRNKPRLLLPLSLLLISISPPGPR